VDDDTTLVVFAAALHRRTGASTALCRRTLVECGMDFELARRVVGWQSIPSPFVRQHMIESEIEDRRAQ